MLIRKHCVSALITESRSFSPNIDTCCKQDASSEEASPASLCWLFVFGGVFFKKNTHPVNSALVMQFTAAYHCTPGCPIIVHFIDKAQKGAKISQVSRNTQAK